MLLDEPLSNLDPSLRERTRRELKSAIISFVNEGVSNAKDFESCEIGLRVCSKKQGTAKHSASCGSELAIVVVWGTPCVLLDLGVHHYEYMLPG